MSKILITGMGVISPLGNAVEENRDGLVKSRCALSSLELFPTNFANQLHFGEIKISDQQFKEALKIKDKGVARTTLLALHAIKQAIELSKLSEDEIASFDTAIINGTTVGGMCHTDSLYQDANHNTAGTEYLQSYELGTVTQYLQQYFGIKGISNTINTACSSSANAIMYGARLIKNGFAKRAIVGGVDSLAKFTINGFNSLNILSPDPCRPFDKNRSGLNLGEGAGFLVLEKEEDSKDKNVLAELSGYSNTNDAFHPSSLSEEGDGPFLAMSEALRVANLQSNEIGFVNAHGTGTENNDEIEGKAMIRLFEQPPEFASTKSNIGHTLGAAGGIEAVFSILNLLHQEVYESLHFESPVEATGLIPVKKYQQCGLNHVMSNSFGFGGNCSSLIFSKV